MRFVFTIVLSGVLPFALLYQKLEANDGNFAWGAHLSIMLLFLYACFLLEQYIMKNETRWTKYVSYGLLGMHTMCGFIFWCNMYIGLSFALSMWG